MPIGNDRQSARANGVPVTTRRYRHLHDLGRVRRLRGICCSPRRPPGATRPRGDVFTLISIAAAVIGGVSLFGGRGSAAGAVVGAFVLTVLVNVLFFGHVDPLVEPLYEGLFLVVAAALTALPGCY